MDALRVSVSLASSSITLPESTNPFHFRFLKQGLTPLQRRLCCQSLCGEGVRRPSWLAEEVQRTCDSHSYAARTNLIACARHCIVGFLLCIRHHFVVIFESTLAVHAPSVRLRPLSKQRAKEYLHGHLTAVDERICINQGQKA